MNLSLRTALILALLLGLLLPASINGYFSLDRQLAKAEADLHADHARIADVLALGMQEPLWNLSPEAGRPLLQSFMSDERVVRISVNDATLGRFFLSADRPDRVTGHLFKLSRIVSKQGNNIGTISVELDDGRVVAQIHANQRIYLIAVALQVAISMGLILFLLESRLLRPVNRLTRQSLQLAQQDLSESFEWQRNDELGRLGRNLEHTRRSLRQLIQTLEQKKPATRSRFAEPPPDRAGPARQRRPLSAAGRKHPGHPVGCAPGSLEFYLRGPAGGRLARLPTGKLVSGKLSGQCAAPG